MYFKDSG